MKYIVCILFLAVSVISFSQDKITVKLNEVVYTINDSGRIFEKDKDVTNSVSEKDREILKAIYNEKLVKHRVKLEKDAKKELKAADNAEKKAEKKQKKAEKALKKNEKLQNDFTKAQSNLEKAQNKYNKLKKKGKLSPVDDTKWIEKIDKLKEKLAKTNKKLKRG